jgi:hypothetical protein
MNRLGRLLGGFFVALALGSAAARADCTLSADGPILPNCGETVIYSGSANATLTLPRANWKGTIVNIGAGSLTVVGSGGVPVNGAVAGIQVAPGAGASVSGDPSLGWWLVTGGAGGGGGGGIIWPGSADIVVSNGTSSPAGLAPVNNEFVYATGGAFAELGTADSGVLVTSSLGVPSISTTLPSGLTIPGYNASITWPASGDLMLSNGGNAPTAYGGSSCSGSQFATGLSPSGAISCGTPSGSGNVSTSGTITNGALAVWNGSATVTGTLAPTNNEIVYATDGAFAELGTADSGVLVTNGSGVPSISSTLPSGLTIPGYNASITWPTSGDLMKSDGGNAPTAYGGASCTNQALTALSAAGAGTCSSITSAYLSGSITAAQMLALASGDIYQGNGSNQPADVTLSAAIDAAIGSTQGDILYRGASAWSVLAPGTNGYVLTSGGAAANPSWAPSSGGSTTITLNPGLTSTPGTCNTGSQTVTNGSTLSPQDCTTAETSNFTVAFSGSGASTSYAMNGSASITATLPSAASAWSGTSVCFIDAAGHGFSVASGGGSFYGGGFSGSGTISVAAGSDATLCVKSDGTNIAVGAAYGVQPVANGGTGTSTAPSSGQLLIGTSGGGYSVANLTAGSNVTITNSSGGISIAAGGGGVTIAPNYQAGNWYLPYVPNGIWGSTSTHFPAAGDIVCVPAVMLQTATVEALGTDVTTLDSGGNVQVAIYSVGSNGLPSTVIVGGSSMSTTTATRVTSTVTNTQVPAGPIYLCDQMDNATAVVASLAYSDSSWLASAVGNSSDATILNVTPQSSIETTGTYTSGSWPNLSSATWTYINNAAYGPLVGMQVYSVP